MKSPYTYSVCNDQCESQCDRISFQISLPVPNLRVNKERNEPIVTEKTELQKINPFPLIFSIHTCLSSDIKSNNSKNDPQINNFFRKEEISGIGILSNNLKNNYLSESADIEDETTLFGDDGGFVAAASEDSQEATRWRVMESVLEIQPTITVMQLFNLGRNILIPVSFLHH